MDYFYNDDFTKIEKNITSWLRNYLKQIKNNEEPEQLFLDYITIMIGKKTKMCDIETELVEFLDESKLKLFIINLYRNILCKLKTSQYISIIIFIYNNE